MKEKYKQTLRAQWHKWRNQLFLPLSQSKAQTQTHHAVKYCGSWITKHQTL